VVEMVKVRVRRIEDKGVKLCIGFLIDTYTEEVFFEFILLGKGIQIVLDWSSFAEDSGIPKD